MQKIITFFSTKITVIGMCETSLWISSMTPYTLYGKVSGNNSEVDIELSIFVSRLYSHNLRLVKIKVSEKYDKIRN